MANTLKLRGGTTAEVAAATLAEREIMVDTTKDVIVVGPGKKEMAVANGGTYTGNYTFSGDVTINGATTFGSSINANSLRIQNVATPTGNSDATNKSYVDAEITTVINTTLPGNVFSADSTIDITDNNPGVGDVDLSISDSSITTAKLVDDSVTTAKILDNNVTGAKFANDSITTAKLQDQAVTSAKLAVDAVTSNRIQAAAVGTTRLADTAVTAIKIATDAVTTDKIQDDAVTADKIANTAVTAGTYTAADITVDAQGRITAAASGEIGPTEIADDAITTAKILDGNVTTAKIANLNITEGLIADAAVTAAKIDPTVLAGHAAQVVAAANSATAAATSAAAALAAFDDFDDTYLGAFAADPTTDNDGDAITAGDLYFNTTNDVMRVFIGTNWVTAFVPGDAANISNTANGNLTSTNVQLSLQELQGDIDTLNTNVTANDTDITTQGGLIAGNATQIGVNAGAITAIGTQVTTNTADIATNETDIATNVTDIAARLPLAGGTMTGDITFNAGQTIDGYVEQTGATASAQLPVGTQAQRDTTPAAGMIRFNDDVDQFEGYNGTAWSSVGGGATGGGGDQWALEMDNTISNSYTISTGKNVISAGPLTINSGAVVTVPAGSSWVIV